MEKKTLVNVLRPFTLNLPRNGKVEKVHVEVGVQRLEADVAEHWFAAAHLGPMPERGSRGATNAADAQRAADLDRRETDLGKREAELAEAAESLAERERGLAAAEQDLAARLAAADPASGASTRKGSTK